MKKYLLVLLAVLIFYSQNLCAQDSSGNKPLHQLFDAYYEEYLKLFPLDATSLGDTRYNDLLPNTGAVSYRKAVHDFYTKYQNALKQFNYQQLEEQDNISYDILMDKTQRELGKEKFHPEYMPINQSNSLPSDLGQLGAGTGAQPFKTIKDYDD